MSGRFPRWGLSFLAVVSVATVVAAAAASAMTTPVRTTEWAVAPTSIPAGDTLQVGNAGFRVQTTSASCPGGSPSTDVCFLRTGTAKIPGLGAVTETDPIVTADDNQSCIPFRAGPVTLMVAGKQGALTASVDFPTSCDIAPGAQGTLAITGGSGIFANASGNGTFQPVKSDAGDDSFIDEDDIGESSFDTLNLTLTAPNTTFDLTPPVISGARSKTVRAPKGATFSRVKFRVTAQDAVDGPVPTTCKPRSGSRFKIGRTKVKCSATDSSANKTTKNFTITVKRR